MRVACHYLPPSPAAQDRAERFPAVFHATASLWDPETDATQFCTAEGADFAEVREELLAEVEAFVALGFEVLHFAVHHN